jgi:predicted DNA-binding transcriptional regulator
VIAQHQVANNHFPILNLHIKGGIMEEVSQELLELCYIANQRNVINNRRMRALGRKHYYLDAIKNIDSSKKWQKMGKHKLRSLALKAEAEYVFAQYETMELTLSSRRRVATLKRKLNARTIYDNGYIGYITVAQSMSDQKVIYRKIIKELSEQYEANKAVEKMLVGK